MGLEEVLEKLADKPLLKEFAEWLYEHKCYGEDAIEELLCKEWDGAYPSALISDDLLVDIGSFLCFMAMFALERVYGEDWWTAKSRLHIRIVPEPSYDDRSYVYVLELKTRTVMAVGCERKTWHYDPETIEGDLKDLIEQLEKSEGLIAVRMVTDS